MSDTLPPLLLVGCGKMGGAMLAGWRERGLSRTVVVDPNLPEAPAGTTLLRDAAAIPADFAPAAVVLATKPQEAPASLPHYARFAGRAVFVSVMAGKTVAGMRALLGPEAAVVRAMPNTPAAVRQGFTVGFAGPGVTTAQQALADTLLGSTGEVAWVGRRG
jgi:pyrroline-5-carboxylate reductase